MNVSAPVIVTAAVLRRNGRIFVTRRLPHQRLGGMWEFPGGKVEAGESPEAALRRELMEELGVDARVGALLESVDHTYEWGRIRLLAYDAEIVSGEPELRDHDCGEWVLPEELANYAFTPADLPIVDALRGGR